MNNENPNISDDALLNVAHRLCHHPQAAPTPVELEAGAMLRAIVQGRLKLRALVDVQVLDRAVQAYKVGLISRMAMETEPEGIPTADVADKSIREGIRAAIYSLSEDEAL